MSKEFKIGDKLSLDDIEVGMIVDLLPYNQIKGYPPPLKMLKLNLYSTRLGLLLYIEVVIGLLILLKTTMYVLNQNLL